MDTKHLIEKIKLDDMKKTIKNLEVQLECYCPAGMIPIAEDVGIIFMSCRNDIVLLAKLGLEYIENQRAKMLALDDEAKFTWAWNHEFFLETAKGNFIWSCPDYINGDNTIRPYQGRLADYYWEKNITVGRSKGKHIIREYCGEGVRIIQ